MENSEKENNKEVKGEKDDNKILRK